MKRILLLILTFGLFAYAAYAHNGMQHVMGTVTAITNTSVSVKTINGTVQTVILSVDTKYLKGAAAATLKDIRIGDRIVVHATKMNGQLTAAEVKVGTTKQIHGDTNGMRTNDGTKAPQ